MGTPWMLAAVVWAAAGNPSGPKPSMVGVETPNTSSPGGALPLNSPWLEASLWNVHHENQLIEQVAKVAMKRSGDPAVRSLAERLALDHGRMDEELVRLARSRGQSLLAISPNQAGAQAAAEQHRQMMDKLQDLSGPAFDHEFMVDMLGEHNVLAQNLVDAKDSTQVNELKDLLGRLSAMVAEHQRAVETWLKEHTAQARAAPAQTR
jgi:predicted outer membrane protein